MQDKCFNKDFDNGRLCAFTRPSTFTPTWIHQNIKMLFPFCLSMTFAAPADTLTAHHVTTWSWECLSEANWIFPHISINDYYAYNYGFSLPPPTIADRLHLFLHYHYDVIIKQHLEIIKREHDKSDMKFCLSIKILPMTFTFWGKVLRLF